MSSVICNNEKSKNPKIDENRRKSSYLPNDYLCYLCISTNIQRMGSENRITFKEGLV